MTTKEDAKSIICRLGVPIELANDVIEYFMRIENELRTLNLEKSSSGKFVETIVQILQSLYSPSKKYDKSVKDVENELKTFESRAISGLNDESRLGIIRISRSIQCLRSKRSIVHKNLIDPNVFDLEFIFHASQWIVTELVRLGSDTSIDNAKSIVSNLQKSPCPIVEVVLDTPLVLSCSISAEDEIVILLYSEYSSGKTFNRTEIGRALIRRNPTTVTRTLNTLWNEKLIDGNREGYALTRLGVERARKVIDEIANQ